MTICLIAAGLREMHSENATPGYMLESNMRFAQRGKDAARTNQHGMAQHPVQECSACGASRLPGVMVQAWCIAAGPAACGRGTARTRSPPLYRTCTIEAVRWEIRHAR
jgi:hypothetical protein